MEKTPSEHLEWCIERAMEYFNNNEEAGAINSFISDVRKHSGTAHINAPGAITLVILQDGASRGSKAFEEAMRGFAV